MSSMMLLIYPHSKTNFQLRKMHQLPQCRTFHFTWVGVKLASMLYLCYQSTECPAWCWVMSAQALSQPRKPSKGVCSEGWKQEVKYGCWHAALVEAGTMCLWKDDSQPQRLENLRRKRVLFCIWCSGNGLLYSWPPSMPGAYRGVTGCGKQSNAL